MKTIQEQIRALQNECEAVTQDLNSEDVIMDSEWREELEARREQAWEKIKELKNQLPVS